MPALFSLVPGIIPVMCFSFVSLALLACSLLPIKLGDFKARGEGSATGVATGAMCRPKFVLS